MHTTPPTQHYAIALRSHTFLCFGPIGFSLPVGADILLPSGHALQPPYKGVVLHYAQGARGYVLLLQDVALDISRHLPPLAVKTAGQPVQALPAYVAATTGTLVQFMRGLESKSQHRLLHWLMHEAQASLLMQELQAIADTPNAMLTYGSFIAPHIMYFEARVEHIWPAWQATLSLVKGEQSISTTTVELFQLDEKHFAGVAVYDHAAQIQEGAHLTLWHDEHMFRLEGNMARAATGLEFVHILASKPDYQKHVIREHISAMALRHVGESNREDTRALLEKLQCFITTAPEYYTDPAQPFSFHAEHVVPVGTEGVFISGWKRDPYRMLQEVEAISALGITMPMCAHMFHFHRQDIADGYRHTPHGMFDEQHGFACYVRVPAELQKSM